MQPPTRIPLYPPMILYGICYLLGEGVKQNPTFYGHIRKPPNPHPRFYGHIEKGGCFFLGGGVEYGLGATDKVGHVKKNDFFTFLSIMRVH